MVSAAFITLLKPMAQRRVKKQFKLSGGTRVGGARAKSLTGVPWGFLRGGNGIVVSLTAGIGVCNIIFFRWPGEVGFFDFA